MSERELDRFAMFITRTEFIAKIIDLERNGTDAIIMYLKSYLLQVIYKRVSQIRKWSSI